MQIEFAGRLVMDLLKSLFIGILAGALTISTAAAQDSQANVDRSSAKNLFRVFDSKGPVELNKGSEEQKKSCPQFIERNKANEMFGRQFQCEYNNVVPPKNVPEPPQPMMCSQMQGQPGPMMPHVFMRHMNPMMCQSIMENHNGPMMMLNGPMMPPPPFMPMFGHMKNPMMRPPVMFMPQMFFGGMKNFAPANKDEFMKRAIAYTKLEMELTPKFKELMLNKFDVNKDGMLSDEEIKSAVESHYKNMRMRGPKFDHNKPEQPKFECEKCKKHNEGK